MKKGDPQKLPGRRRRARAGDTARGKAPGRSRPSPKMERGLNKEDGLSQRPVQCSECRRRRLRGIRDSWLGATLGRRHGVEAGPLPRACLPLPALDQARSASLSRRQRHSLATRRRWGGVGRKEQGRDSRRRRRCGDGVGAVACPRGHVTGGPAEKPGSELSAQELEAHGWAVVVAAEEL